MAWRVWIVLFLLGLAGMARLAHADFQADLAALTNGNEDQSAGSAGASVNWLAYRA